MRSFPQKLKRVFLLGTGGLCLLLLSGCGDDRPVTDPGPGSSAPAPSAATPIALAPAPAAEQTPDPLLSGAGAAAGSSGGVSTNDPLLRDDPLKGPSMPTEHSHWLNTETNRASISILLNGKRLSSYQPSGTQDITMKLYSGPNTLTVIYTPQNVHSWGSVTLTEGEHQGQGISLAEFHCDPLADSLASAESTDLKPTTQTFTFVAN
ncbi:MAG: hypothetical protein ACRYFS_04470 [Janthinobacterium lividum]